MGYSKLKRIFKNAVECRMTQQDSHRPVNLKDDEETTMSLSKVLFRRPSECTEQKTKIFRHDSRCAG